MSKLALTALVLFATGCDGLLALTPSNKCLQNPDLPQCSKTVATEGETPEEGERHCREAIKRANSWIGENFGTKDKLCNYLHANGYRDAGDYISQLGAGGTAVVSHLEKDCQESLAPLAYQTALSLLQC